MARIIQHICLYCQRRFKGNSSRYMSHIRKHRQWYRKYRYQLWKSENGYGKFQKHPQYSKDFTGKISPLKKQNEFQKAKNKTSSTQAAVKSEDIADGSSSNSQLLQDALSSSVPKESDSNDLSQLPPLPASSSSSDVATALLNPSHRNRDGLPTMVASIRHMPSRNEKKHYKCSFCEKTFSGGSHLLLHERTHTGEKPHFCRFCPKSFAQKGYLKIHERIHTGERPFKCGFCEKAFCTKEDLRRHERIHTGEKPYKCKICGRGFSQRSYRNKHETIHAGERPFASKPANWDTLEGRPTVDGDTTSQLPPSLMDELKGIGLVGSNGHVGITAEVLEKLKDLPPAQQQALIEGSLIQGRGRGRPKGSTNRQNYNCRFCGRDCRSSSQLKQHERTHTGEKPYSCKFCHKSFSQRGYARIHERIHTGEKPFPCKVCEKAFGAKEDLRRHQRTHTGEKPYKCELCGKAFAQNSALIGHRKTHLNEISNLDYTTHSFVGMKQPTSGNFTHFLGPGNLLSSAHMLQKMATEASGTSLNLTTTSSEGNKSENPDPGVNQGTIVGISQQVLIGNLSSLMPNLPNLASVDGKAAETKETQESGGKKGINDIAARLLASKSESSTSNAASFTNSQKPVGAISQRRTEDDQKNVSAGCSSQSDFAQQIKASPEGDKYSVQPSSEAQQSHSLCENQGVSISDHIRMQLSISTTETKTAAPAETTLKEHQQAFVNKKNKINNLASQLLSAKTLKENQPQQKTDVAGSSSPSQEVMTTAVVSAHPVLLAQNDSIYHRAAQLIQPKAFKTDHAKSSPAQKQVNSNDNVGFSYLVPLNFSNSDQTENKANTVVSIADNTGSQQSLTRSVPGQAHSTSETLSKEQGQAFVSKKNNINDLASQLLSAKTLGIDASPSVRSSNTSMMGGLQEFSEGDLKTNQSSSVVPARQDDVNLSREGDSSRTNIAASITKESTGADKSIHDIAAQLISTKSNHAQSVTEVSSSGFSFEEEMLQRKQKREMLNSSCSKTSSIRPSITSICRPLQGVPNRRTLQNW